MKSVAWRGFIISSCWLGGVAGISSCSDQASPSGSDKQKTTSRPAIASAITSSGSDAGPVSDATVDANNSPAVIQAWIDQNYYAEADIQHSFHTIFGEKVDCIDFYAQHAVKSLVAAGTAVTLPASPPPQRPGAPTPTQGFYTGIDESGQSRGCAGTTVATTRPTVAGIQASGGITVWRMRGQRGLPRDSNEGVFQPDCYKIPNSTVLQDVLNTGNNYEHVAAVQDVSNTGIYEVAALAVPSFGSSPYYYDHSDSQIWIQTGDCELWVNSWSCSPAGDTGAGIEEAVQSLEVGWQVNPAVTQYHDYYSHLFLFVTNDGYDSAEHDLWNGDGHSFVIYPGGGPALDATLATSTTYPLPEVTIQVNSWYGLWWVFIDGYTLGYVPGSFYVSGSLMANGQATRIQAGGEVFSGNPEVDYTDTGMGSGFYANSSNQSTAAWVNEISYINGNNETWYNASMGYCTGNPSYEEDLSEPGVCGMYAGYFYNKCDGSDGCTAPNGISGSGYWFYFGGSPGL